MITPQKANKIVIFITAGLIVFIIVFFNKGKMPKRIRKVKIKSSYKINTKENCLELYYNNDLYGKFLLTPIINQQFVKITRWDGNGEQYKGIFKIRNYTGQIHFNIIPKVGFAYWVDLPKMEVNQITYFANSRLSVKQFILAKNNKILNNLKIDKLARIELKNLVEREFAYPRIAMPMICYLDKIKNVYIKLGIVVLDQAYKIASVNISDPTFSINFKYLTEQYKYNHYLPLVCVIFNLKNDKDILQYRDGFYKKYYGMR